MKTWRERIVEAKERGKFTEDDKMQMGMNGTCMAAEAASGVGKDPVRAVKDAEWRELWDIGDLALRAVCKNEINKAERYIDLIEDMALELKRRKTE